MMPGKKEVEKWMLQIVHLIYICMIGKATSVCCVSCRCSLELNFLFANTISRTWKHSSAV